MVVVVVWGCWLAVLGLFWCVLVGLQFAGEERCFFLVLFGRVSVWFGSLVDCSLFDVVDCP